MKNISVIGLGKLGVCIAACFASKGFNALGVDINEDAVNAVNGSNPLSYEPGLVELFNSCEGRLRATKDYLEALEHSDTTLLIVPTPSKEDGNFSDRYLLDAIKQLSLALKKLNKKYHLFVITSTVSPGTVEESIIPCIESVSGKRLNNDFGVCYNPEFIALGSIINDLLSPDLLLIGESDKKAGDQLQEIYANLCDNKPHVARMSIVSAEITKISLNSYITMKISFANTLSNICESVPGADIDAITGALGADKRISGHYFRGGLAYGGPCFPRDNRAFSAFAGKHDVDALLAKATDKVNRLQIENIIENVIKYMPKDNGSVAILGLAYKPDTPVIEESPSIKLVEKLLREDVEIIIYDPLAVNNAKAYFGDNLLYASSIEECFSHASVCVVTTQTEEFKSIDNSYIVHNPTTIIDCWRMLNPKDFNKDVIYIPLGKSL